MTRNNLIFSHQATTGVAAHYVPHQCRPEEHNDEGPGVAEGPAYTPTATRQHHTSISAHGARISAMSYVADLHTHSPYARGTSPQLTFENMALWAKLKGIDLLATGDFTHPAQLAEIRAKLHETGDGLFDLDGIQFVLGTEVNCSAKQAGQLRRVHVLVFAPDLEAVASINSTLDNHGKLASDGRPTVHMTPRDLLETLLGIDERCFIIPAHLWTPHFGLYGEKSGFDSLAECFGDLASYVPTIETGLSSDPAMNWRVPSLDGVSIVSFSDAHSLPKLGRELTVFLGEPSYDGLLDSLRNQAIEYTLEMFPEEGKYHHAGHRKCALRLSPQEAAATGERCPKCGRKLTSGVMQRIEGLAKRIVSTNIGDDGLIHGDDGRPPFRTMIALRQIIAESLGRGVETKAVASAYHKLVEELLGELQVLTKVPASAIESIAGERVAEGVVRARMENVTISPGFDGEYGHVRIWPD